ncbi:hypothetical protein SNOG_10613 [Parastagonospora nodorum SN15]|uniref:Uncharacterized protein n=1 Tax=Phaeosphaeria nodorum (strain SN15 / ATCC MYA-4574 / FGSC 10173) TaxID=321614 RepID=Q0UCA1_PHANO|nr:hypothetical protein SNOG_10613 [Parastagonospora nodorum SN15]EAT82007.2 hypothetical protein SNOG_10613 [Parastagonospora nodorum SN15]
MGWEKDSISSQTFGTLQSPLTSLGSIISKRKRKREWLPDVDEGHLEHIWKMEEQKIQDRQARKVGEEIGYLYFVGVDGLLKWKDDYLRSDRGLVYRKKNTEPESDGVMSMSDSGDSDSDDSREDEYKDRGEDEEDYDEMDMDM